jgi:hypothetical protein
MAQALEAPPQSRQDTTRPSAPPMRPAYQAYLLLYAGFVALPIVAGLDKFFHLLTNWDMYLAPAVQRMLSLSDAGAHNFMLAVGVIEIVAGLIVAIWPRVGGYVVGLWLWGIVVNLLLARNFYDIALRDFGLSIGAFALAWMARELGRSPFTEERPGFERRE